MLILPNAEVKRVHFADEPVAHGEKRKRELATPEESEGEYNLLD
jgi:hypothetical protein